MTSNEQMLSVPGAGDPHPRFWWQQHNPEMLPYVYRAMEPDQVDLMREWFADTGANDLPGETTIPAISLITSLVSSSSISRVVQLGHFAGYSTLMIGFCFVNSHSPGRMVSIDLDPKITKYTEAWIERAGLDTKIRLFCGDSADPQLADQAIDELEGGPELIFLDSSHAYEHTLRELDLWYPLLEPGGLILLHDVSQFATQYDATNEGGVRRALDEWSERNDAEVISINRSVDDSHTLDDLTYHDGCGLGIIQKPLAGSTPVDA